LTDWRRPRAKPLNQNFGCAPTKLRLKPTWAVAATGEHEPSALTRTLSGYAENVGRRLEFFDHAGCFGAPSAGGVLAAR